MKKTNKNKNQKKILINYIRQKKKETLKKILQKMLKFIRLNRNPNILDYEEGDI